MNIKQANQRTGETNTNAGSVQDMQDMQEAHNTTGEFFVFALTNV